MRKRDYETLGLLCGYLFCLVATAIVKILDVKQLISHQTAKDVYLILLILLTVGIIGYFGFCIIRFLRGGIKNVNSCGDPLFKEIDDYREHWGETKEHYENMINVIWFYYKQESKVDKEVGTDLMRLYRRLDYLNGLINAKDYLSNCMMSIGISFATSFIVSFFFGSEETLVIRIVLVVVSVLVMACVILFPHSSMLRSGACGIFEYEKKQLLAKIENAENAARNEEIDEESLKMRKNVLDKLMKQNKKSYGKKSQELDAAIREVEKLDFHKSGRKPR